MKESCSPDGVSSAQAIKQMYRFFDLCKRHDLLKGSRSISEEFDTLTATQVNNLILIRVILPCNLSRIVEMTGLSPAGASYFIDRLVQEKIVHRQVDPRDRRQVLIHPTERMLKVFDAMDSELDAFIEKRMSHFTPEESTVVERGAKLVCRELDAYFRSQNCSLLTRRAEESPEESRTSSAEEPCTRHQ